MRSVQLNDPRHPNYINRKFLKADETKIVCEKYKKNPGVQTIENSSEELGVNLTTVIAELQRKNLLRDEDHRVLQERAEEQKRAQQLAKKMAKAKKPKPHTAKENKAISTPTPQAPVNGQPRFLPSMEEPQKTLSANGNPIKGQIPPEDVFKIRDLYGEGNNVSQSVLAKQFGTHQTMISRIVLYKPPFNNAPYLRDGESPVPNSDYAQRAIRKPSLSPEKALEIRAHYEEGDLTQAELAKKFDISTSVASKIINQQPPYHNIKAPIGGLSPKPKESVSEPVRPAFAHAETLFKKPEPAPEPAPQVPMKSKQARSDTPILDAIHAEWKRLASATIPRDEWVLCICVGQTYDLLKNELDRAGLADWAIHNNKITNLWGTKIIEYKARPDFGWFFRQARKK